MKVRLHTNRVVFHHSEGRDVSLATVREWHRARGFEDIGYHVLIHKDGELEHGRDISKIGAHAFGKNNDSVGVLLFGDFSRYEPTVEQLDAATREYHALCRFYNKTLNVEFHTGLSFPWLRGKRVPCPGPKLDREDFLEIMYRASPFRNGDHFDR